MSFLWSSRVALLLVWICMVLAEDDSTATSALAGSASNATASNSNTNSSSNGNGSGSGGGHLLPEDMRKFLYLVLESKPLCSEAEKKKLFQGYANNKQLFSECFDATGYVIFPNKGTEPTAEQIRLFVGSMACMKLFTGLVRADYRECEIYKFSPRSGAETMLRIRHDMVVEKRPAPSQEQYHDVYLFNRAVNTLSFDPKVRDRVYANGANAEFAYDTLVAMRSKMYLVPGVTMTEEMKIVGGDASGSSSGIDSSDFGDTISSRKVQFDTKSVKPLTTNSSSSSSAPSVSKKSAASRLASTSDSMLLLAVSAMLAGVLITDHWVE